MQMQRKQQQLLGSMHLIIRTWHQEVEDWCRLSMMEGHTVIRDGCSWWISAGRRTVKPLLVANNLGSN